MNDTIVRDFLSHKHTAKSPYLFPNSSKPHNPLSLSCASVGINSNYLRWSRVVIKNGGAFKLPGTHLFAMCRPRINISLINKRSYLPFVCELSW